MGRGVRWRAGVDSPAVSLKFSLVESRLRRILASYHPIQCPIWIHQRIYYEYQLTVKRNTSRGFQSSNTATEEVFGHL